MASFIKITEIKKDETHQAAITLFEAFKSDPMMQWIFGDDKLYAEKGITVFETWVKYCVLYGKAFKTNNFESVALRKMPGDKKFTFWRMLRSGILRTPGLLGKEAFMRLMKFDDLTIQVRQEYATKQPSYWYCWLLGTKPQYQKQGFGSALMRYTFDMAKQNNLPCYLETANEASKQVHLRKGYKVVAEFVLPDSDVTITSMAKESS